MKNINVDVLHEELIKNKPILAFDENQDYNLWKKQVKDKVVTSLITINVCLLIKRLINLENTKLIPIIFL